MRKALFAVIGILAALALPASATPIQLSTFGQTSSGNTLVATANGTNTATNLLIANAQINISQLFGQVTPIIAGFNLVANSTDAAATALGLVVQHFAGSFCLTSGPACGGINFLSGVFTDAAVGKLGGPGLVVNVTSPPDTLNLTSALIPPADLLSPATFNLAFSNVAPNLAVCGATLCSFDASFAGSISSTAVATETPEPASLALMGAGLIGLAFLRRRKRAAA